MLALQPMMITKRPPWVQSLNADGRYGAALLLTLVVLLLPAAGGESWRTAWRYDRVALQYGEWWRLVSAHVVHLGNRHLLFNAVGLLLLWCLFARSWRPRQWLLIVLLSMLGIDAGLWLLSPDVQWYVGASGVLHGVWAAGAWSEWRGRRAWYWLPAALLAGKLLGEQWQDRSLVVGDMPVVLAAHLYGAVSGLLLPLVWQLRRSQRSGSL
jgi:rhomboid family GlyGly-CTERM serine protease